MTSEPAAISGRLAALEQNLTAAAALTSDPGARAAGDAGLWEYARTALDQARELAAGPVRLPLAS